MRRTPAVLGLLVSLCATLLVVPGVVAPGAATAAGAGGTQPTFEPAFGATFNDPSTPKTGRLILRQVVKSVEATEPGEMVRLSTWSYGDAPTTAALTAAAARGVAVQVIISVVAGAESWDALRTALNKDDDPNTFAMQCSGGCRSRSKIMHEKYVLFSRVGTHENVSMITSSNMTGAARHRQWNDLLTTHSSRMYEFLGKVFDESAKDTPVKDPSRVAMFGHFRVWAFPAKDGANPQLAQLEKVRCHGATQGTGTRDGRTKIRISVAAWFDSYGQAVADRLRLLWDRGCDIRIVTTRAGGGIVRTLRAGDGRGPVPIRRLAYDHNGDGVPERYLHQKSMAISGVFAQDTSASVVLTGSPNWSTRPARSEEILVRTLDRPGLTRRYLQRVNSLFTSDESSDDLLTRAQLDRALARHARVSGTRVPVWLELD
jgi:hypothetical protein